MSSKAPSKRKSLLEIAKALPLEGVKKCEVNEFHFRELTILKINIFIFDVF